MKLTETQKFKLKKFVKELDQHRRSHTELITVYVPKDYDLNKIINHLQQEQGTASNIKSASTKKNVIAGLEKMIQHLRLFKKTPENGLAVFAGNVAEREGQEDLKVWSIEPPIPLNTRIYRCDKNFILDLLYGMMEDKEVYGLIVVDRRDANIAFLKGKSIIPLVKSHSQVPGKMKAGGQCQLFGTLVQSASGSILKIENCHNPHIVKSMIIGNYSIEDSPITDKWDTRKTEVYKIKTKFPQLVVESSKDHIYFVLTENGISEKSAEELNEGDYLLTPEKIDVKGKLQKINSKKYHNRFTIKKEGRNLLKKARLKKGLHQRQLAKKLNLTQTGISFYEIGKNRIDPTTLKRLCDKLDINFDKFLEKYATPFNVDVDVILPKALEEDFAQFLGYYTGDGCSETDRITFFEQRKEVALAYKKIFDEYFNIKSRYSFRESKNYHQLRFTSRPLVRLIKQEFPEIKKTLDTEFPKKILESKNKIVAKFLKGFFDAEGYVMQGSLGIASNNKTVIGQTQLLLLRFSIISSFSEQDNRKNPYSNNPIFKLQINDKESLNNFYKSIGFTSKEKSKKLLSVIKNKSEKSNARQIITSGKKIREIIEKAGYNTNLFPKVNSFFRNERMMGKSTFKNSIMKNIKDKSLYKKLEKIYRHPILPVKIHKIEVRKEKVRMADISVKNQNFIANGLIVHNSAARFSRLREGAIKDHFKKIADHAKNQFLGKKELKGIIVGGPGPSKNDFIDGNFLTTELKEKIIGIKDLSYTGDFGLQELLEKSEDILSKEDVIEEKNTMQKFFDLLNKKPGMVSYGEKEVMKTLQMGAVELLLVSENLDDEKIEELEEEAKKVNTEVKIISTETREGAQLREMGNIAAILRYEV